MSPLDRAWRGGRNDWQLHLLSIFSVAVAFVCLGSAALVVVNVDGIRTRWAHSGRASVYLKAGVDEDRASSIDKALRDTAGVADVAFVSSSAARKEVIGLGADAVIESLPVAAFPASLEVKLADGVGTERLESIATKLRAHPAVESVETYQAWSDRLASVLAGGVTASMILALVVLGAVVSVVSSTIRLALQRRRIEVEVLKLVGATDGYVRRPFVLEGAAQGAIGAAAAVLLLAVLYAIVRGHFDWQLGALLGLSPSFLPWTLCLGMVALGGLLGAAAAFLSLRRLLIV